MKKAFLILLAAFSLAACSKKDDAYPAPAKQESKTPSGTKSNPPQTQPLRLDKDGKTREPNQGV